MGGFYDIAVTRIDGTPDLLGALRGKVTLAVNVASQCGLTPQYQGLEELQRELSTEQRAQLLQKLQDEINRSNPS